MLVAVIDDYQRIALRLADWSSVSGISVVAFSDHCAQKDALVERLLPFDCVVAMRERTLFAKEVIESLPNLRLLVTTGMANAAIDLKAARECGILVCGTDHDGGRPTAELTWALISTLVRHVLIEDQGIRAGRWQETIGMGLDGKVLSLLGLGRIGSHVARIGRAFGMSVIAWSQHLSLERADECMVERVDRDELFSRADVLSIHMRLSERTRFMVGGIELGLMKPSAYLVNTSRGEIVDEEALIRALHEGTIAGAALDVFTQEPLPRNHGLLQAPRTILTPHIGIVTDDCYKVCYGQALEDIEAYLAGQPIRVLGEG